MAEMRGHMAGMRQSQQQQQPSDPFEAERSKVLTAQRETHTGYRAAMLAHHNSGTTMSDDDERIWQQRNNDHTVELGAVGARQEMARVNTPESRQHANLVAKYPDVMNNDKAFQYATATYQAGQAAGEIPQGHSAEHVARIMKDTARRFSLNGSPDPTDQQNSSYARGGRAGAPPPARRGQSVTVGTAERRMALSFYKHRSDMSEGQKIQAFVNFQHDDDEGG
jgi:hypothetical protein